MKFLIFLFLSISYAHAVDLKWTKAERKLLEQVKNPQYFIDVHKNELKARSEKSIDYVIEAFAKSDRDILKSSRIQIPFHRLNDWEERQMILEEAKKFILFKEMEEL